MMPKRTWFHNQETPELRAESEQLHAQEDQVGRQVRALEKKCAPLNLNREAQSASFQGSGKPPYVATLSNCTCRDFILRQQPCKHMYRLAHELGIYPLDVPAQGAPLSEFDPFILDGLSEDAQKELHDLLNLWMNAVSDHEWIYEKNQENCLALIEKGFLEVLDMPEKLLQTQKISALRTPLNAAGIRGNASKEAVIKALLELDPHAADELKQKYIVVRVAEKWRTIRGKMRTYLKGKLPKKTIVEDSSDLGFEKKESWTHFIG